MKRNYLIIGLVLLTVSATQAQIRLNNPSFEAPPKDATMPPGWVACGMYTTPDIMPGSNEHGQPIWDVTHRPVDGATYVGLITREDNTREYLGQQLNKPLKSRHCYMFSLNLASSPFYAGYNTPIRLRIWLGNDQCQKTELIVETQTITHYEWKNYQFVFSVDKSYSYIIFEASYADGTEYPYRGNLLMDNISLITDCDRA